MAEGACREATDTSAAVKSLPRTLQWTLPFLFESRNPHACHIRSLVVRIPVGVDHHAALGRAADHAQARSEEHTSELQSRPHLVCRLLLEKKKKKHIH